MKAFEDWQPHAACQHKPTDWWFPTINHPSGYDAARQICRHCPVTTDCLNYAVTNSLTHGMFGGLTPDERHNLQPPPENCGTSAGYKRHRRENTFPCDPCTIAHREACRQARVNRLANQRLNAAAAELTEVMW